MNTHPVCGWLFPMTDPLYEDITVEEMATALAEMEAPFPSDAFDLAVSDYMLMPEFDLHHLYRTRC